MGRIKQKWEEGVCFKIDGGKKDKKAQKRLLSRMN